MNLIRFLLIGGLLVTLLGELGKYPFGSVGNSVSLLDVTIGSCGVLFLIWKIGIKKQIDFPKVFGWFIGFLGIGLLSDIFNWNFDGILYLVRFSLYGLIFWMGFDLAKSYSETFKQIVIGVNVFFIFLGFLQLIFFFDLTFLTDYGYDPHIGRLTSTFLDPNFAGAFLVLGYAATTEFLLRRRGNQKFLLVTLFLFLIGIVLTFSRSAWVMFVIFNLFIAYFLPRKLMAGIIVVSVLAAILIPRVQERLLGLGTFDITSQERVWSWQKGVALFQMDPTIGIGFNNIRSVSTENGLNKVFSETGGNSGGGVDSSLLLILATTGVAGLSIFGYFYGYLIYFFVRNLKKNLVTSVVSLGILVSLLVESQFINSLFYPGVMLVFFLLIGLNYGLIKKSRSSI